MFSVFAPGRWLVGRQREEALVLSWFAQQGDPAPPRPSVPSSLTRSHQADIHQLINRHPFVQVLSGAAACLATLAAKDEVAARQLASTAAIYASWLRDPAATGAGDKPQLLCRFLYILGQLCRRGAGVLESTAPESGGAPLTLADCQRIFVQYCNSRENVKVGGGCGFGGRRGWTGLACLASQSTAGSLNVPLNRSDRPAGLPQPVPAPDLALVLSLLTTQFQRACAAAHVCTSIYSPPGLLQVAEAALGAIGALSIAQPSVLVDKRSPAHRIMKQALSPVGVLSLACMQAVCATFRGRHASTARRLSRLPGCCPCLRCPVWRCLLPPLLAPQGAPELFKLKALSNLIELLRADEEHMMAAQQVGVGACLF